MNSHYHIHLENIYFLFKNFSYLLIIFKRAKLSTRSITHLCWFKWSKFWRKNAAGISPRWPCSCTIMPRLTGHLQPKRNCPNWVSNVLITNPILRTCPCRITTCSLEWKKTIESRHFSSGHLLPRRPGWTEKFLIFLSGLQKWEQRAKTCIDFCGEYVEITPNLVAVASFLPGRVNYFSAPPCMNISTWSPQQLL